MLEFEVYKKDLEKGVLLNDSTKEEITGFNH